MGGVKGRGEEEEEEEEESLFRAGVERERERERESRKQCPEMSELNPACETDFDASFIACSVTQCRPRKGCHTRTHAIAVSVSVCVCLTPLPRPPLQHNNRNGATWNEYISR